MCSQLRADEVLIDVACTKDCSDNHHGGPECEGVVSKLES